MIGEVVGNYRIASQIGSGGMGAVYLAHHELLGKTAAIKVLLPERSANREIVERFFNEARAVSAVHHPGIPEIFDFGHLPSGNAYIIMELLEGETLGDRLKRVRPLSSKESVSIARHIAGVLSAAHSRSIVHRDLKPDNVFLVPDPALPRGERAKILDFGIAKLAHDDERPSKVRTETGRLMGTPYYMSPEQCRGSGYVDHRSDIYSLGCVLYQMLTGRPPFVLEGSGEILAAHIHVPPIPPRQIVNTIPVPVEAIVMRLLAKDKEQRFQTMDEVIHAFNSAFPRNSSAVDTEPSLQLSSATMPAQTTGDITADSGLSVGRTRSRDTFSGPTTLGSSASESMATIPNARRSNSWIAYIGLAAAAVAASFFIYRSLDEGAANGAGAANNAAAQVSAAAPTDKGGVVIDSRPVVRPIEEPVGNVTLLIESEPDGAKVYRESDGVFIGNTPVRYEVRKGKGEAMFIVKKRGYRSAKLAMRVSRDDAFMVDLKRKRRGGSDEPALVDRDAKEKTAAKTAPGKTKQAGAGGGSGDKTAEKNSGTTDTTPADKGPGEDDAIDPFSKLKN